MKRTVKIGGKTLPRLVGNGKIPGGILHLRHHRDDGLDTDRTGKPAKISEIVYLLVEWSHNEFGENYVSFGNVTQFRHRRGVKEYISTTENGYENFVLTARISTRAMRTSMAQTTSTRMTRTPTRASCTTCEHGT